jgi:hypothetical protein
MFTSTTTTTLTTNNTINTTASATTTTGAGRDEFDHDHDIHSKLPPAVEIPLYTVIAIAVILTNTLIITAVITRPHLQVGNSFSRLG